MREYRFKLTLQHKYDRDKSISHHIYAKSNSEANLKATIAFKNLKTKNLRAREYELKEVVYDPDDLLHA